MTQQLPPMPSAVGIFTPFIASQTETLILKGHYVGGSLDVTLASTGAPLLTVKAEAASLSHRKHISDMQGRELCTIRRETWTIPDSKHYYAEDSSGTHLFDLNSKIGLGGSKNTVAFNNTAGGGNSKGEFFFKNNAWGTHGTILDTVTGQAVGEIDREMFTVRREYHVTVPAGVDMVLIVGICVAMDDKAQVNKTAAAGAAGVAGGAGT